MARRFAPKAASSIRLPDGGPGWAKRSVPTFLAAVQERWARRFAPLPTLRHLATTGGLPPLQHDLAARLSALQKRMRAFEVRGVDRAQGLVEGGAQHALVDEVGHIVEQVMLRDHVRRLERGAGEHR